MLRGRLQSQLQLLALPHLLGGLRGGSSSSCCLEASSSAVAVTAAAVTPAHSRSPQHLYQQQQRRGYAADAEPALEQLRGEVQQAAHELGLDAVPMEQLKVLMDPVRLNRTKEEDIIFTVGAAPNQRKLTYGDLPGWREYLQALASSPQDYAGHMPSAPMLDASQWIEAHFKEAGYSMEPSGPFYVWRAWAAAHLPQEQYETLVCVHEVMGVESTRSAFVKQAQHELARLWDWQQRRAALGLAPDIPLTATPTAAAAAVDDAVDAQAAAAEEAAALQAAAEEAAAAAQAEREAAAAAAAAAEAEAAAAEAEEALAAADVADKDVLDVLEDTGSLISHEEMVAQKQAAAAAAQAAALDSLVATGSSSTAAAADAAAVSTATTTGTTAAPAAAAAGGLSSPPQQQRVLYDSGSLVQGPDRDTLALDRYLSARVRAKLSDKGRVRQALSDVKFKLEQGENTAKRGKFIREAGVPLRVYQPVAHDGDIFLPTKPLGNKNIAATLADPSLTAPIDPAAATADATTAAAMGYNTWLEWPQLDRSVLHQEELRQAAEKLAAKPKAEKPWQLLSDGYSFDLQQRPPTAALDLLSSYLEIRYADVLLQRDAVQTTNRQLALQSLLSGNTSSSSSSGWGSGGFITSFSEVVESPPTALTAAKTLSPQEREAVGKTLDDMLSSRQYSGYREAVLQLYCDGLVGWGELQECWAAAQAGEEAAAATEGPVSISGDRQQLFQILSGQQPLNLTSSSSSSTSDAAAAAAARKVWEEAGVKLAAAAGGSSSSSGGELSVRYEEAERTWQQLLHLTGQTNGPRFDQVLLAGSSSSSSSDGLQQQLQRLQASLQRVCGLGEQQLQELLSAGSSSSSVDELQQQLQRVFAAPPSLQDLLQQQWQQVAQQELGHMAPPHDSADSAQQPPTWSQMWKLLEAVATQHQHQQQQGQKAEGGVLATNTAAAGSAVADGDGSAGGGAVQQQQQQGGGEDAASRFERYLREADSVPLTPPPYPGARRLLRWEQRLALHAASGDTVLPQELKVKLAVSAVELAQETGLGNDALQYMLAVAGPRYNPATGDLTIACDRFPTREENRRWCLEVLHRLLQAAQGAAPADSFWLDSSALGVQRGYNPAVVVVGGGGGGGGRKTEGKA